MNPFSFLAKGVSVEEVAKKASTGGSSAPRKQRNPNPAILALRLFKDGSIYPSQAAVDKFDLDYHPATITKDEKNRNVYAFPGGQGNGFDIIDSRHWSGYKAEGNMLFIAPVGKGEAKVDLFKQTSYDEATGKPVASVMSQGTATFGKEVLVSAVQEVYGITLGEDKEYVDLVILDEVAGVNITRALTPKNGYSLFPKRIIRGKDQGKPDYQRRENPVIYALVPADMLEAAQQEVAVQETPEEAEEQLHANQDFEAANIPVEEISKLPYKVPQEA